jgi:hypothetical protein
VAQTAAPGQSGSQERAKHPQRHGQHHKSQGVGDAQIEQAVGACQREIERADEARRVEGVIPKEGQDERRQGRNDKKEANARRVGEQQQPQPPLIAGGRPKPPTPL